MMKDEEIHHQDTGITQELDVDELDLAITSTMLQLLDYPLPDPDENVGVDPYNSA